LSNPAVSEFLADPGPFDARAPVFWCWRIFSLENNQSGFAQISAEEALTASGGIRRLAGSFWSASP